MRRALHLLMTALVAVVLSVLLVGPAAATETTEHAEEAATGFGSGDWDGLIAAAVAGIVIGAWVFATSSPGEIGGHGAHH